MEFLIKHFNDLNTNELYEIVKSRFEVFVMEQKIVDEHDLMIKISFVITDFLKIMEGL